MEVRREREVVWTLAIPMKVFLSGFAWFGKCDVELIQARAIVEVARLGIFLHLVEKWEMHLATSAQQMVKRVPRLCHCSGLCLVTVSEW